MTVLEGPAKEEATVFPDCCEGRTIWGGRFFRFGGIQVAAAVALTRDASPAHLFTAFDLGMLV